MGIPLPPGKCDFPDYEVLYLPQYFSSSCYFTLGNSIFSAVTLHLYLTQTRVRMKALRVVLPSP